MENNSKLSVAHSNIDRNEHLNGPRKMYDNGKGRAVIFCLKCHTSIK